MDPFLIGIFGVGFLLFLMFFGMPIGFAMIFMGFLGYLYLANLSGAFYVLFNVPYHVVTNYEYCVLPLFLFMSSICARTGFGESLFKFVNSFVGKIRGGLAIAAIGACAIFAAVSASTIATALTIGKIAIPEMKRYGYKSKLSCGSVAGGGVLGILIPPSGIFIIYGIITEQSIAKLFVAGIIPGLILTILFIISIVLWTRIDPELAPKGSPKGFREKMSSFLEALEMLFLVFFVLAGLLIGWFTPTEAGALGAFGSIVLSLIRNRLSWKAFKEALIETSISTGIVFTILIGALIFNAFLAVSTLPMEITKAVSSLKLPPMVIILMIVLTYFILGCFIDSLSMVLLTLPITYPVVTSLGFNPIWFGVIMVLCVEMAVITPPVGMNVYVIAGISEGVPMEEIFKGIIPFIFAIAFCVILLVFFPKIALFLPEIMG